MIPLKLPSNADQITVTDTATSLPALIQATSGNAGYIIPGRFNSAILQAEDGDIRYSVSNDPTTSVGMQLLTGGTVTLDKIELSRIKLIRDGASNVKVNITIFESNTLQ